MRHTQIHPFCQTNVPQSKYHVLVQDPSVQVVIACHWHNRSALLACSEYPQLAHCPSEYPWPSRIYVYATLLAELRQKS